MRWAHKQSFVFIAAVIAPSILGITHLPFTSIANQQVTSITIKFTPTIQCFDLLALTTLTTTDQDCPPDQVFLGIDRLTESRTATGDVVALHPLLSARFATAQSFARADGVELFITSGFRSQSRQQLLFEREVEIRGSETEAAKWVLPPQSSHHPRGLSLDVNYPGDKAGALWLERNGARFGLCRVYANEWWHFEGTIAPGESCPALAPNALVDFDRS